MSKKTNKPDHIFVDQKRYDWNDSCITGAQIKDLAGVDPQAYDAWQDVPGPEDILVGDNDKIDLTEPGVEKFFTGKKTTTEG
jgi:hypothetical protein